MSDVDKPWYEQPWPAWESHWLSDDSVESLCKTLGGIEHQGGPRLSRRKLRLFLAGCLRRVQHVFQDGRNRDFVDVIERYADGMVPQEELHRRWGLLGDPPN